MTLRMNESSLIANSRRRIVGEAIDIDYRGTHEFFEARAARATDAGAITTVLYQDAHPEVAEARHEFELKRVMDHLGLERSPLVLDIGCGNGRWARSLSGRVSGYLGIDFSAGLVAQARTSVACMDDASRFDFQVLSAVEVGSAQLRLAPPFELVIVAGVLLYLNDDDARNVIDALRSLVTADAVVYVREPVALGERLTLTSFESEELGAAYSAVYRPASFYRDRLEQQLARSGFSFVVDEPIRPELTNRPDTTQHYFVLRGGAT